MMPLKTGNGFVKIMRDRTTQHAKELELIESEARFRMLATSIPQLVFRSHVDGARSWGSPQWEVYAGLSDAASRGFGWMEAYTPTIGRSPEVGGKRPNVRPSTTSSTEFAATPTVNIAGIKPGRGRPEPRRESRVGTSADVHEMRGLQDRQQVLLSELQHRTRNLLALVQAIARQRSSPAPR